MHSTVVPRQLVERDAPILELERLLAGAQAGQGALAVLNGASGLGKTALLEALTERATAAGAFVLRGTGSRNEQQLPYALLSQLIDLDGLNARPGTATAVRPAGEGEPPRPGLIQRVFQTVSEMAAVGTVFITVDDAQYADTPSLQALHYLAHRATGLPVMIVLTCGTQPNQLMPAVLQDMLYSTRARNLHLSPLSEAGVAEVLAGRSSCPVTAELAGEYFRISGGNPLLLGALNAGEHPCGDACLPQPGEDFARAILTCVHRIGPVAVSVARSVALMAGAGTVTGSLLSRLSDTGAGLTDRMIQTLSLIGVLDGPAFRHPAAQAAILDDISGEEAVRLHYRAARVLYEEGEAPHLAAQHIRVAGPLADDWAVSVLRDAARQALAGRQIELAIQCLELAAECCSDEDQRLALKVELATIYWQVRPATSTQHYLSLRAPILAGKLSDNHALKVADGLLWHLRVDEAQEIIQHLTSDVAGPRLSADSTSRSLFLLLESSFPGLIGELKKTFGTVPAQLERTADTPELRASQALAAVLARTADEHTIARAEQVLRGADLTNGSLSAVFSALLALIYSDRLDAAAEWATHIMVAADQHNAPISWACAASYSALIAFRRGFLDAAIEQSEAVLERTQDQDWFMERGLVLATLVECHTAVGNLQAAAEYLIRPVPQALFQTRVGLHYLHARAQHQLARGKRHAALADFTSCGERMADWNIDNAAIVPWRIGAADAWLGLNDKEKATELLEEQLAGLRPGLDRTRGITLRALASVREPAQRPAILQKSLELLQLSGDRYETARVLADLSGAYRVLGARELAKAAERRASRIAKSCHGDALRQLMPASMVPGSGSGASEGLSADLDALGRLSTSERPVAVLAAQGYTNREISAKLFITVSTVEQHLTRIYRKMDIRSREELPAELNVDAAATELV